MNYGKDRQPGDDMACPLCRKEFTIPDDPLSGMQKSFVEKLLSSGKLSAGEEAGHILCDVCSSDEGRPSEATSPAKPATKHCLQCQQNYCDQCSWCHTKIKAAASHVVVEIGKEPQKKEIVLRLPTTCDEHREIKVSCVKCQLAIFRMFLKSHETYDCSDIEELLKKIDGVLIRFEIEKKCLNNRLADIEGEINVAAHELIAAVQVDRAKLLSEVEWIRVKRGKQLEAVKEEVEQHEAALESLKRDSETLLSSGTACDVSSLHSRAEELMMFDVISHVDSSLPSLNVTFKSSTFHDEENRIGTISEEGL